MYTEKHGLANLRSPGLKKATDEPQAQQGNHEVYEHPGHRSACAGVHEVEAFIADTPVPEPLRLGAQLLAEGGVTAVVVLPEQRHVAPA